MQRVAADQGVRQAQCITSACLAGGSDCVACPEPASADSQVEALLLMLALWSFAGGCMMQHRPPDWASLVRNLFADLLPSGTPPC